ncbi:YdaS family helix-turn-helix protein [Caballeronia sp. TF1N1]|uniref:transcriptional regulator n=1 Tax=Caballeronia sp. TF1N1 TaxID=2878153 RepID=UPI001FD16149|nr:YdaS family helix-turn-helix protein [Caballeronia sp. TF1N1]
MKSSDYKGPAFDGLMLAVSLCGTQTELARRLGKRPPLVWQWLHRDGGVPIEYVARVVHAVNDPRITPFTLRPDYPYWRLLAVQLVCAQMDRDPRVVIYGARPASPAIAATA